MLMKLLRLIALDEDDLKVFSAHLQDALLRVDEMAFLPQEKRFAALLKRFDWLGAGEAQPAPGQIFERRQAALRFERVLAAQYRNLPLEHQSQEVRELLAIDFELAEPPGGYVSLVFAGGGAIRLQVECIEAELRDLGPVWRTRRKPEHPGGSGGNSKAAG